MIFSFTISATEAVSRLIGRDFDMLEVSAISGHKRLQMLKRYTHLKAET